MDPSILITIVAVAVILFATLLVTLFSLALPAGLIWMIYKQSEAERKLLTEGDPAVGQIVSAEQTGVFINHNPQVRVVLDIQPMEGEPYQANVLAVVQMLNLARVQPGNQVDLRIDPTNRARIAIVGV